MKAQEMQEISSVAVLMTCFNRKEITLRCLKYLFENSFLEDHHIQVYLVDDGSKDDTTAAIHDYFPSVKVIQGNGDLFWGGGTHLAFQEAVKDNYPFYLWLNDDTLLYQHALTTLLNTYKEFSDRGLKNSIIVGSTQDPETKEFTYGGRKQNDKWHPFHFAKVTPTQEPQSCDTMNGNCVLIPESVVHLVGLLDPAFSHYAGDFDYGLRAKALGCSIWSAPGYMGTCASSKADRKRGQSLTLSGSLSKLLSQKGLSIGNVDLHPFLEWKKLTQRHGGIFWIFYWLIPYRRIFWQVLLDSIKRPWFHE